LRTWAAVIGTVMIVVEIISIAVALVAVLFITTGSIAGASAAIAASGSNFHES